MPTELQKIFRQMCSDPNRLTIAPCNCMGPQNGEPLCPCQMRTVQVKNGRYVMPERDLGPVISNRPTAGKGE